jgi:hypothetical protein
MGHIIKEEEEAGMADDGEVTDAEHVWTYVMMTIEVYADTAQFINYQIF